LHYLVLLGFALAACLSKDVIDFKDVVKASQR
jgi:hypothetical protein